MASASGPKKPSKGKPPTEALTMLVLIRKRVTANHVIEVRSHVSCGSFDPRVTQDDPVTRQVAIKPKSEPVELETSLDCAKFYACAGGRVDTTRMITLYQRFIEQVIDPNNSTHSGLRPVAIDVSSDKLDCDGLVKLSKQFGLALPQFSNEQAPGGRGMNFTLKLAGLAQGLRRPEYSFVTYISEDKVDFMQLPSVSQNDCYLSPNQETPKTIWVVCVLSESDVQRAGRGESIALHFYPQEAHHQSNDGFITQSSYIQVDARRVAMPVLPSAGVNRPLSQGRRVCVLEAVLPKGTSQFYANTKSSVVAVAIGSTTTAVPDSNAQRFYNPMRTQHYVIEDRQYSLGKSSPAPALNTDAMAGQKMAAFSGGMPTAMTSSPPSPPSPRKAEGATAGSRKLRELSTAEHLIDTNSYDELAVYFYTAKNSVATPRRHPWTKEHYIRDIIKRRRYALLRVFCELSNNLAGVLPLGYATALNLKDPVALNIIEQYLPLLTSTLHRLSITGQVASMKKYLDLLATSLDNDMTVRDIINVPNIMGLTCMHYSIPLDLVTITAILGSYGGEEDRADWDGHLAVEYAKSAKMLELTNHQITWRKANPGKIPLTEAKLQHRRNVEKLRDGSSRGMSTTTTTTARAHVGDKRPLDSMEIDEGDSQTSQRPRRAIFERASPIPLSKVFISYNYTKGAMTEKGSTKWVEGWFIPQLGTALGAGFEFVTERNFPGDTPTEGGSPAEERPIPKGYVEWMKKQVQEASIVIIIATRQYGETVAANKAKQPCALHVTYPEIQSKRNGRVIRLYLEEERDILPHGLTPNSRDYNLGLSTLDDFALGLRMGY